MRYLIFNITVLSALGYLFMASPEQSFTKWIGKAPLMYDAAKTAGRDGAAGVDSSETAGTALLEAMEPVVEEVLSSSKAPTPEQMRATRLDCTRCCANASDVIARYTRQHAHHKQGAG